MDILIGILIIVLGLALVFAGLRVFLAMLPIIGFLTGFFLGATLITNWLGDSFLATATGWIVGLIVGIAFAAISYLYWYIGAILAAGSTGALLMSGLFSAFGVNNGIVLFILAVVGAAIFIFVAVTLALPVYVVLVNTAILGAYMVIGGLLLLLDRVERRQFDWGVARAAVHDSWLWWLVLVALAAVGIFSQLRAVSGTTLPERNWRRSTTTRS